MVKSERQRQKKLAKRQKRASDVRKLARIHRNPSTRDLIQQAVGNRWEITFTREREGMASVVAMRRMRTGNPLSVCFLIDRYCLGVKDAYVSRDIDIDRVREMVREGGDEVTIVSPEYVLKYVRDAIAYARSIGIEPAKDAELCLLMFRDVDASQCHDEFVFGKNGKPLYIAGPYDSPEFTAGVFQALAKLGQENSDFIISGDLGADHLPRLDGRELFQGRLSLEEWADDDEVDDDGLERDELEADDEVMDATDFKRVN